MGRRSCAHTAQCFPRPGKSCTDPFPLEVRRQWLTATAILGFLSWNLVWDLINRRLVGVERHQVGYATAYPPLCIIGIRYRRVLNPRSQFSIVDADRTLALLERVLRDCALRHCDAGDFLLEWPATGALEFHAGNEEHVQ